MTRRNLHLGRVHAHDSPTLDLCHLRCARSIHTSLRVASVRCGRRARGGYRARRVAQARGGCPSRCMTPQSECAASPPRAAWNLVEIECGEAARAVWVDCRSAPSSTAMYRFT
eukprot:1012385-Prymnesium_polylepis.1